MKKQLTTRLAAMLAASTMFAFTACGGGISGGPSGGGQGGEGGEPIHTHTLTHSQAEEATCTRGGSVEYWYCADCGKYYSDEEGKTEISSSSLTVPATGLHTFVENVCSGCDLEWVATEGLDFTLDEETDTYAVSGIGTAAGDVVIPYYYEGKLVTAIERSAFNGCSALTGIAIPDSVTAIGVEAFNACTKLTSVTLPNKITEISTGTFLQCKKLTSISIPEGVTAIRNSAFNKCTVLASVSLPESITVIERSAFTDCKAITSFIIPKSVSAIADKAFYNCTRLTSIVIPEGVNFIDIAAFQNCRNLTDITYKGTQEKWNTIKKADTWNLSAGNYTVHCTDGDLEKN